MKIFVAIPVYDGKIQVQTVKCLLEETTVAAGIGDELRVNFIPNCSVPAQGRNQLVSMFLKSDCEKLFFLDADITFTPGSLLKVAHMPVDFVGGCYRFKKEEEVYPINWIPGRDLWIDKFGLLEVTMLPTGFLALTRNVFGLLKEAYPGREYKHWDSEAYTYFQTLFEDGRFYGEDTYFCKEWIDIGGKIFLDPELELTHWGSNPTPHVGHIGKYLKKRAGIPITEKAVI